MLVVEAECLYAPVPPIDDKDAARWTICICQATEPTFRPTSS
ncbi:hypothetical protein X979_5912 [Burkholderia pseudomallei MSHR7527]|nr:hypothetical protein X979_5912 [Burkholderia pseudomallei MSHR7527]